MYWYVKALKEASASYPNYNDRQLMDAIARILLRDVISEKNQRLLQIYFCNELTQQDLDRFLKKWDIETVHTDEALLLAYVQKHHPDLDFGEYCGPRLSGLFSYHRFHNLELMAHFSKIVKALNKENIFPMILKGGAMKFLRPELPRIMGDMDVLVPAVAEYHQAQKIVLNLGYVFIDSTHSVDVHLSEGDETGILDIHQYLSFVDGVDENFIRDMFARATKQKMFNAMGFLPRAEDLVYISMNNITRNLRENSSLQGIPFAIIDLAYLINLKKDFDWGIVTDNIKRTHQEAGSYLAACFVNQIVPNLIPIGFMAGDEYSAEITKQMNFDREYVKRIFDNKFIWWFSMFRKKVKTWAIFTKYPWLAKIYFATSKFTNNAVMKILRSVS